MDPYVILGYIPQLSHIGLPGSRSAGHEGCKLPMLSCPPAEILRVLFHVATIWVLVTIMVPFWVP